VDCRAEHLVQFAQMGHVFARRLYGTEDPSVALLNVGEERGKGTEVVKEAYERLEALGAEGRLRFIGNVEGRDLFHHRADVAVCDGFVGNLLLKLGESFATVLPQLIRREIEREALGEGDTAALRRVLRNVMRPFDYENFGAAPLLGVAGNVLIGHGGSKARAAEQMLYRACELAEQRLSETIAEALRDSQPLDA
jgi:glycerol-3-phosphate acyltransferase PlsX